MLSCFDFVGYIYGVGISLYIEFCWVGRGQLCVRFLDSLECVGIVVFFFVMGGLVVFGVFGIAVRGFFVRFGGFWSVASVCSDVV